MMTQHIFVGKERGEEFSLKKLEEKSKLKRFCENMKNASHGFF
jgi:hypothetical protein